MFVFRSLKCVQSYTVFFIVLTMLLAFSALIESGNVAVGEALLPLDFCSFAYCTRKPLISDPSAQKEADFLSCLLENILHFLYSLPLANLSPA